jgi:hypothetical protein
VASWVPYVGLFYSGAWHDISTDVYARDDIQIRRGKTDEASEPVPTSMTLTLKNRDGKYNPLNPTSPLWGLAGRNTPITIGFSPTDEDFEDTTLQLHLVDDGHRDLGALEHRGAQRHLVVQVARTGGRPERRLAHHRSHRGQHRLVLGLGLRVVGLVRRGLHLRGPAVVRQRGRQRVAAGHHRRRRQHVRGDRLRAQQLGRLQRDLGRRPALHRRPRYRRGVEVGAATLHRLQHSRPDR